MKKALFDELTQSIREGGRIRRGEQTPSRRFTFTPKDVRAIRERLNKSQSEFAQMIGVTVSTLQNWEQGRRTPQGPARALLVVASSEPEVIEKALASSVRPVSRQAAVGRVSTASRAAKKTATGAGRRIARVRS
jgi:putative transcriptional regulator